MRGLGTGGILLLQGLRHPLIDCSNLRALRARIIVKTLKASTKKCLEDFFKAKKTDSKAQAFVLENYVPDLTVTFDEAAECCVVKGKCFRFMSESEIPHEMKIIIENSAPGPNIVFTTCTCKVELGHCRHLSVLAYAVVSSVEDSDRAGTSKPQQWHVPRSSKINPQPCMQYLLQNHCWTKRLHEVHHFQWIT